MHVSRILIKRSWFPGSWLEGNCSLLNHTATCQELGHGVLGTGEYSVGSVYVTL